jgi:hypothetical protein
MRNRIIQVLALCAVFMFAMTCGGTSDDTAVPLGTVGETASSAVTAATGGTVALASGAASVTIPGNALAADTTITVLAEDATQSPQADLLGSHVFNFGPDGTAFLTPVTLALKLGGAVPDGKKAVLVWLDGAQWSPVAGSTVAGDLVQGAVSHFSRYAIRLDTATIVSEGGACEDLAFTACGGDPTGSWVVEDYCLQARPIDTSSMFTDVPVCGQDNNSGAIIDINYTGTAVFAADKTCTQNLGATMKSTVYMNDACLAGVIAKYAPGDTSTTMKEACDGIATQAKLTCTYVTGRCECAGGEETQPGQEVTGTWTVTGTVLSIVKTGSSGTAAGQPFCVDGSRMVVEFTDSDDTDDDGTDDVTYTDHLVLKRQ